jgi:hypothetical protein
LATATVRHGSASILRRIGLTPLVVDGSVVPPYYDPQYGCEMEALRFDSSAPNPKYGEMIREMAAEVGNSSVICREAKVASWPELIRTPERVHRLPKLPSLAPAV